MKMGDRGSSVLSRRYLVGIVLAGLLGSLLPIGNSAEARACPFCQAEGKTLTQEISEMDVVVTARLEMAPPPLPADGDLPAEVPKAKFKVVDIIKGADLGVKEGAAIEAIYFGDPTKGKLFMIRAMSLAGALQWSTPLALNERSREFVKKLPGVAKSGPDRLAFFQEYLEDADAMLARDAYDEFAKAPYSEVIALKPRMHHDRLVRWISDTKVASYRRRLYFTMLGVCGTKEDVALLESMLRSDSRERRAGLDALIACYLTLKGETGVPLIEELYLGNPKCEYQDTYSAIMAMRFHLQDASTLPKPRVVESLRLVLNNPNLADLVIKDLTDQKDWTSMEKLVSLFKNSDDKTSWVRVPVINYLRRCPLPEAKVHLKELEKLDPEAVKRANSFFPAPATGTPDGASKS